MDPRTTHSAHATAALTDPGIPEHIDDDRRADANAKAKRLRPLPPGTPVGRYVVQKVLGRGGMGIVYGAVDPTLGRRVALKLVRARGKSAERYRGRLQREALALARLSHPNIVGLFDIGTAAHGAFVAMEYIHGTNLSQWLRAASRTVEDVLAVFTDAGRGLAAAHEASLVHRDFKPNNVMVTTDGTAKVLDFGLVRGEASIDPWLEATDDALMSCRLTRADSIVGTTGYMPPEQLLGREVEPASDQFAFCVALFEALYGVRPFPGKTALEQARSYAANARNEVPHRRDIPPRIRVALERGLALDPRERFPTMRALLEALAPPAPPSRRRRLLLLGAVVAATAVTSSMVTTWLHAPPAAACEEP